MKHERYYSSMKLNGGLTVGRKPNGPQQHLGPRSSSDLINRSISDLRSLMEDRSQQWHDADVEDRE